MLFVLLSWAGEEWTVIQNKSNCEKLSAMEWQISPKVGVVWSIHVMHLKEDICRNMQGW